MSTTPVTPPGQTATFDPAAFDSAVESHGTRMTHWRALRCPVGLVDLHDMRRPGEHLQCSCSNGFRYIKVGTLKGLFSGVGSGYEKTQGGLVDGSESQVTFARYYECAEGCPKEEPYICMFDRFYMEEPVFVTTWQLVQSSPTGKDRTMYPIEAVEHVVGQNGLEFPASAYKVNSRGDLEWVGSDRPAWNSAEDRGEIFSIRFRYRPFYYASRLGHQTRVVQAVEQGKRELVRMQQSATLSREYVFRDQEVVSNDEARRPETNRKAPEPVSGAFSAR